MSESQASAHRQRRIVMGVVVATAGSLFCGASFNFVIHPMVDGLQASETQSAMLRQLPGIAGLLAIFVAGVLVVRVGARTCLKWSGALMLVGYLTASLAPSMPVLTVGLLLAYIGKSAVIVIAVSLLSSSIQGKDARASAFASFAMVSPAVCVLIPILVSLIVESLGWRWAAGIWFLGGGLVLFAAFALIPEEPDAEHLRGELWTPLLAGLVLVGLTQVARLATTDGVLSTAVGVCVAMTVAALVILLVLMRRLPSPSMSFAVLKDGGLALLIVVVLIVPFSNMWFYGTLGAQYVYGLSAFAASLVLIPVQIAGVFGARISGTLVKARGLTFTGTALLLGASAMSFLCMVQTTTIPILVPLLILMIYGACCNGVAGTITNSIMSLAPKGQEGSASAFRSAAGSLGGSLGAIFLSTIVFSTMAMSISEQGAAAGLSSQQADQIANSLREGATTEDTTAQYSVPTNTVDQVESFMKQAAVEGYWAQGAASGVMLGIAAAIFYFTRRRIDRRQAHPEPTGTPA